MDARFFETLYAREADPWRFDGSWYEARKRALLLASLPAERYASAFEPGCATGHLTAELALRCDALLASDGSAAAALATRQRLQGQGQRHVTVMQAWLPRDWPCERRFDLIVLSEFLYYLPPADQAALAAAARASLHPGGTIAACHWRHPIPGCEDGGDAVHARLGTSLSLPQSMTLRDADFCLDVWSADASAAAHEGRA